LEKMENGSTSTGGQDGSQCKIQIGLLHSQA